jgi:phosphoglycolate phosphatase
MRHKYDLIVFDWDGTLMNSAAKIVRCFEAAIEEVGIPCPDPMAIRHIIGLGLPEAIQTLLPESDGATQERVIARYREHFLHLDRSDTELFPGVTEGLERLSARGYQLGIATGKARRGLDRAMAQTRLAHLFSATRCADEAFSKPHPRMLEDVLQETATARDRALMVGDTIYDLLMARNARVDAAGVTYGVHLRDDLLECAPVVCLDSFEEICQWLE